MNDSFLQWSKEKNHMPLDPQVQAFLDQQNALNGPAIPEQTVEEAREGIRAVLVSDGPPEPVAHVENRVIPGLAGDIPVRVYTPQGSGPFPVLVYFHGGGWVIGDLNTHDGICRSLTNLASCLVVSVGYRLAPEHKFPAAPDDCYAVTCWLAEHAASLNGDPSRIAVGGDSAGGNLTAVVAQMARDRGGPSLVFQLMVYPVTDLNATAPSIQENAEGYFLTRDDMVWFTNHYLNSDDEKNNPLASPLLAPDLHGLPPALIITAEYDPLRDEGEMYGQRLIEAGVPVVISRYDGMIHAFFGMPFFDRSGLALAEGAAALRAAFASGVDPQDLSKVAIWYPLLLCKHFNSGLQGPTKQHWEFFENFVNL
jgi:acetyl esterase